MMSLSFNNNTMGDTSGAGTSGAHELTLAFCWV